MSSSSIPSNRLSIDECYGLIEAWCFRCSTNEIPRKDQIGLELEMLVTHQEKPVSLKDLQRNLQKNLPLSAVKDGDVTTALTWDDNPRAGALTFEPGAQLEIATAPEESLQSVEARVTELQHRLDKSLESNGIRLDQIGANPWHSVDEIGLQLAKSRYKAMDHHFQEIGPWGRVMMRQTMTVQVCLDFGQDMQHAMERYIASQLISPYAAAIFANSPFLNKQKTEWKGVRTRSWAGLDRSRTGYPGLLGMLKDPSYENCVRAYADAVLDAQVIYVAALEYENPKPALSMRQWLENGYKGVYPGVKDLEQHVTLMFPEVRPKGFLELRSVDGQLRALQMVPAAFFVGLLYDRDHVQSVCQQLADFGRHRDHAEAARYGLEDEGVFETAKMLCQWAIKGLKKQGFVRYQHMLEVFCETLTYQRQTPADQLLASAEDGILTYKHFDQWNDWWRSQMEKGKI